MKSFNQYRQGVLRDRILESMVAAEPVQPEILPNDPSTQTAPTRKSGAFFNNMRFAPGLRNKMMQKRQVINPQTQQPPQI